MSEIKDYRALPFSALKDAFVALGEADESHPAVREMVRRTRGQLVNTPDNQDIDWPMTARWADHVRALQGAPYAGQKFSGGEFRPVAEAFRAATPPLHEPFTLHQLAHLPHPQTGTLRWVDPQTDIEYPGEDPEAMDKLAYLSAFLGLRDRTFYRDDLDRQEGLIPMVSGKATPSANVRQVLADRDRDGKPGGQKWRRDAAQMLLQGKQEGFSLAAGGGAPRRPFEVAPSEAVTPPAPALPSPASGGAQGPVRMLLIYDPGDASKAQALKRHLTPAQRNGKLVLQDWAEIKAGAITRDVQRGYLDSAEVVLVLLSFSAVSSDEILAYATRARQMGRRLVPILVGFCDWQMPPWGELRPLPDHPVKGDEDWVEVARGLGQVVEKFRSRR